MPEKSFESCFSSEVLPVAQELQAIVRKVFPNAEEGYYGGAKVKLVLYSQGGSKNVLCGIQEGKHNSSLLYVHHLDKIEHERLKFSGKGKHAKQVRFDSIEAIIDEDIEWLLERVKDKVG
mgnify:CR=1 FL=1